MHRRVLVPILLVLLLAAGCGGDENGGQAGGDGGSAQTIHVSATDFEFGPAELTADAGEISIELTNDGQAPHAIEIEGNGVEEASETIQPGDSTTLTLALDEGSYEVYCPVGNHADMGMVGTLTVGSGGAGAGTTDGQTETGDDGETHTGETETGETETGETDTEGAPGY